MKKNLRFVAFLVFLLRFASSASAEDGEVYPPVSALFQGARTETDVPIDENFRHWWSISAEQAAETKKVVLAALEATRMPVLVHLAQEARKDLRSIGIRGNLDAQRIFVSLQPGFEAMSVYQSFYLCSDGKVRVSRAVWPGMGEVILKELQKWSGRMREKFPDSGAYLSQPKPAGNILAELARHIPHSLIPGVASLTADGVGERCRLSVRRTADPKSDILIILTPHRGEVSFGSGISPGPGVPHDALGFAISTNPQEHKSLAEAEMLPLDALEDGCGGQRGQ